MFLGAMRNLNQMKQLIAYVKYCRSADGFIQEELKEYVIDEFSHNPPVVHFDPKYDKFIASKLKGYYKEATRKQQFYGKRVTDWTFTPQSHCILGYLMVKHTKGEMFAKRHGEGMQQLRKQFIDWELDTLGDLADYLGREYKHILDFLASSNKVEKRQKGQILYNFIRHQSNQQQITLTLNP